VVAVEREPGAFLFSAVVYKVILKVGMDALAGV
jgi:hypothetical protein